MQPTQDVETAKDISSSLSKMMSAVNQPPLDIEIAAQLGELNPAQSITQKPDQKKTKSVWWAEETLAMGQQLQEEQDVGLTELLKSLQANYGFNGDGKLVMDKDKLEKYAKKEVEKYQKQRTIYLREQLAYETLIRARGDIEDHGHYYLLGSMAVKGDTELGSKNTYKDSIFVRANQLKWRQDREYNRKVGRADLLEIKKAGSELERAFFSKNKILKTALESDFQNLPEGGMLDTRIRRVRSQENVGKSLANDPRIIAIAQLGPQGLRSICDDYDEPKHESSEDEGKNLDPNTMRAEISDGGKLDQRHKSAQTMNVYNITSNMVFHNVETKVRELVGQLLEPMNEKHKQVQKQTHDFRVDVANIRKDFSDLQTAFSKANNPKREIDSLHVSLDHVRGCTGLLQDKIEQFNLSLHSMNDKINYQLKELNLKAANFDRFIERKKDDNTKLQDVLDSFKDRMVEKFKVMTDEFTSELKAIDKRYMDLNSYQVRTQKMQETHKGILDDYALLAKHNEQKIKFLYEEVEQLQKVLGFEKRLLDCENGHKSDIVGLKLQIQDLERFVITDYFTKEDTYRLCYNLQVDCAEHLFDPKSHKIGEKISSDNPKCAPELQSKLNLYDWQIKMNKLALRTQQQLEQWMKKLKVDKQDRSLIPFVKLRNSRLVAEISQLKIGAKAPRQRSANICEHESLSKFMDTVNKSRGYFGLVQNEELERQKLEFRLKKIQIRSKSFLFRPHKKFVISKPVQDQSNQQQTLLGSVEATVMAMLKEQQEKMMTHVTSNSNVSSRFLGRYKKKNTEQSEDYQQNADNDKPDSGSTRKKKNVSRGDNRAKRRQTQMERSKPEEIYFQPITPEKTFRTQNEKIDTPKFNLVEKTIQKPKHNQPTISSPRVPGRKNKNMQKLTQENKQKSTGPATQRPNAQGLPMPKLKSLNSSSDLGSRKSSSHSSARPPQILVSTLDQPHQNNNTTKQNNHGLDNIIESTAQRQPESCDLRNQSLSDRNSNLVMELPSLQESRPQTQSRKQESSGSKNLTERLYVIHKQTNAKEKVSQFNSSDFSSNSEQDSVSQQQSSIADLLPVKQTSAAESSRKKKREYSSRKKKEMKKKQRRASPSSSSDDSSSEEEEESTSEPVKVRKSKYKAKKAKAKKRINTTESSNSNSETIEQVITRQKSNRIKKQQSTLKNSPRQSDQLNDTQSPGRHSGIAESYLDEVLQDYVSKEDLEIILNQMEEDIYEKCRYDAERMAGQKVTQLRDRQLVRLHEVQSDLIKMMTAEIEEINKHAESTSLSLQLLTEQKFTELRDVYVPEKIEEVKTCLTKDVQILQVNNDLLKTFTKDTFFNIKVEVDGFRDTTNAMRKRFTSLISDFDARMVALHNKEKAIEAVVKIFRDELINHSRIISTLVELDFIQQSLDFQDEYDKRQINLYGLNEVNLTLEDLQNGNLSKYAHKDDASKGKGTQTGTTQTAPEISTDRTIAIKLSDECTSCGDAGIRRKISQAFKMACIHYEASPVLYRGYKFDRKKLIEAKRTMLDCEWEKTLKNAPFDQLYGKYNQSTQFYDNFENKLQFLTNGKHYTNKRMMEIFSYIDSHDLAGLQASCEQDLNSMEGSPDSPTQFGTDTRHYVGYSTVQSPRGINSVQRSKNINLLDISSNMNSSEKVSPREIEWAKQRQDAENYDQFVRRQLHQNVANEIDHKTRSLLQSQLRIQTQNDPEINLDDNYMFTNRSKKKSPKNKAKVPPYSKHQSEFPGLRSNQSILSQSAGINEITSAKTSLTYAALPIKKVKVLEESELAIDTRSVSQILQEKSRTGKFNALAKSAEGKSLFKVASEERRAHDIEVPLIELRQLIGRDKKVIKDGVVADRLKELNDTDYINKPESSQSKRAVDSQQPFVSIKTKGNRTMLSTALEQRLTPAIDANSSASVHQTGKQNFPLSIGLHTSIRNTNIKPDGTTSRNQQGLNQRYSVSVNKLPKLVSEQRSDKDKFYALAVGSMQLRSTHKEHSTSKRGQGIFNQTHKSIASKSVESNPENDETRLESKLQINNSKFEEEGTEINMKKLKDIARQKKILTSKNQ